VAGPGGALAPKLLTILRDGNRPGDLRGDVIAGLAVTIAALPLSMALGFASAAGPREGLLTAIVAGFVISATGGSRVQIGGPTGAFVVVAGVITTFGSRAWCWQRCWTASSSLLRAMPGSAGCCAISRKR
jgi:SulP family sulfate permease